MKQRTKLLSAAVLAALVSGGAYAQSSVTVFGILDVNVRSVDNDGTDRVTSVSNNGINSGRWGFRGVEDLGGGWKASFWLESDLFTDTGQGNATKQFSRQSTVSLHGPMGELRLGRHYTPAGWNEFEFDPWSVIGGGGSAQIARFTSVRTFYRTDNGVHWYLPPTVGGIYGQFTWAPDEGAADGRYLGGRLGYKAGPLNTAVAYGEQQVVGGEYTTLSFGVSYKFSLLQVNASYHTEELLSDKEDRYLVGAVVPLFAGKGELRTSYARSNAKGGTAAWDAKDADLMTIGYIQHLSRRTALYGTAARIDNKGTATFSIAGGASGITPGGTSIGFEAGIRHMF
jgi:predicted porin